MNALDVLKERGFIKQITFEEDLYKAFETESVPFYVGFDPTADSLHIGHYILLHTRIQDTWRGWSPHNSCRAEREFPGRWQRPNKRYSP